MRNCYTYLIGWSKLNVYYYGKSTRQGCHPSKLWKTYFTSSKYVKQFRKEFGAPDIIQIRKEFGDDFVKCSKHESTVLTRMNCAKDPRFLNKRNKIDGTLIGTTGVAPAYDSNGMYLGLVDINDPDWGIKIFGINKGSVALSTKMSEIIKKQVDDGTHNFVGDDNPSRKKVKNGTHHFFTGSAIRDSLNDVQRNLVKNGNHYWQSDEHSAETSRRTSELIEKKNHPFGKETVCPHCDKKGQVAVMKRWHFEKCKFLNKEDNMKETVNG